MGRAPGPGAVARLADLRRLPPRRGPQPDRRSNRTECVLGVRDPHSPGPPLATGRHRDRTRCARARPCGRVRRTRQQPRDSPPPAGRLPEPAVSIVRSVRHDQRLAEILIGAPAGQPEFAEWLTLLGDDSAAIPFLRYLPGRLSPLGVRVGTALRERLAEAPSFVAFEGYDSVTVLADCCVLTARTGRASPHRGRALQSRAPAGRSSSPARPASAFGSGLGRQPRSQTGIRHNPAASGSSTPPERARRRDCQDVVSPRSWVMLRGSSPLFLGGTADRYSAASSAAARNEVTARAWTNRASNRSTHGQILDSRGRPTVEVDVRLTDGAARLGPRCRPELRPVATRPTSAVTAIRQITPGWACRAR